MMKKLKDIAKKILSEQASGVMHVYQGCNLQSGPNTGVGNQWGLSPNYDGFIANIMWNNPGLVGNVPGLIGPQQAGSLDASLINNSSLIHAWFGSPSVGEVVRFISCPNINICIPSCLKYLGTETSYSNGNYQGVAWSHDNDSGRSIHPDCNSCGNVSTVTYDCDPNTGTCSDPGNGMGQYSGGFSGTGALAACQAACSGTSTSGCTDINALNYNPSATTDDGSCTFGFNCVDVFPGKPTLGKSCEPGNQNNPGQFFTLQDCINLGCGPTRADKDRKLTPDLPISPFSGTVGNTLTGTPLEPDPIAPNAGKRLKEILQNRAGIKK